MDPQNLVEEGKKRKENCGKREEDARGMGLVTISEEGEHVQLSGSEEN
jgi:hypothetical protein